MSTAQTPQSVGNGRFSLDRRIATGGMGEVWEGTDTVLGRTVAVKLLKVEFADDPTFNARFLAEARNAARLHHPGVASVFDFGDASTSEGERPFLVMELVDGQTVSQLLASGVRPTTTEVVEVIAQIADALQAAHDEGVVHRDVKPSNLIVTPAGVVKVTDFGIAKAASDTALTGTGEIIGTPHYISPEQASGQPATPASDIYSLGVVLYECLAGVRPFVRETPVATALAHVRDEPPPLPDSTPRWLAGICSQALAKDPSARPGSAATMAADLRAGVPTTATATSVLPAPVAAAVTGEPATRNNRRVLPVVIGALAVLTIITVSAAALTDDRPPAGDAPAPASSTTRTPKTEASPSTAATTASTTTPVTTPSLTTPTVAEHPPKEDKPPKDKGPGKGHGKGKGKDH